MFKSGNLSTPNFGATKIVIQTKCSGGNCSINNKNSVNKKRHRQQNCQNNDGLYRSQEVIWRQQKTGFTNLRFASDNLINPNLGV